MAKPLVKRDAAPGRMSGLVPAARLEQHRIEHSELDDFAGHAVDLDEIADANAVLAHQHEPADEADDEVLERHGEAGAGESEEGAEVVGRAEDDEQDEQHGDDLQRHARHHVERLRAPPIDRRGAEDVLGPAREQKSDEHDHENDARGRAARG